MKEITSNIERRHNSRKMFIRKYAAVLLKNFSLRRFSFSDQIQIRIPWTLLKVDRCEAHKNVGNSWFPRIAEVSLYNCHGWLDNKLVAFRSKLLFEPGCPSITNSLTYSATHIRR